MYGQSENIYYRLAHFLPAFRPSLISLSFPGKTNHVLADSRKQDTLLELSKTNYTRYVMLF